MNDIISNELINYINISEIYQLSLVNKNYNKLLRCKITSKVKNILKLNSQELLTIKYNGEKFPNIKYRVKEIISPSCILLFKRGLNKVTMCMKITSDNKNYCKACSYKPTVFNNPGHVYTFIEDTNPCFVRYHGNYIYDMRNPTEINIINFIGKYWKFGTFKYIIE